MGHNLQVIRSNRKTMALQINRELQLTVRAPYKASDRIIAQFVEEHSAWIEKHMEEMKQKAEKEARKPLKILTDKDMEQLADQAVKRIPPRVRYYADLMKVTYGRITIRNQKTRWGSCSSKGNLNFNCLLMLAPEEVVDYVVVHELCHRIEMNHSEKFWKEVEKILPDYRERREWLKINGNDIIRRMTGGR